MYISAQKQNLRATLKNLRAKISEKDRKIKSREIVKNFYANIPVTKNLVIAGFMPIGDEADIRLLFEMYSESGNKICLPVVTAADEAMDFRQYIRGDELIENPKYKFLEPKAERPTLSPNIIITPLLGFDDNGYRLGYGGGFYDRTFRQLYNLGEILTVGVAFECQKITEIPVDKFDEKLDCVVTEKQVYVF
jgi:5-formyltetrahydrofolate cyclo-ligase